MHPKFDVPGFPDGTEYETIPATCTAPDLYVTPQCAHDTVLIHIPLDISVLPQTGAEVLWWVIPVAWFVIAVGGGLFMAAYLAGPRRNKGGEA